MLIRPEEPAGRALQLCAPTRLALSGDVCYSLAMDHALSVTIAGEPRSALNLARIWDVFVRAARKLTISDEERFVVDLVRKSAASLGAERILGAGSVGDLEARLDEAVLMPSLHDYIWEVNKQLLPKLGAILDQVMAPWEPAPEITLVLGAGPAAKLAEQVKLVRVIVSIVVQMLAARGPEAIESLDDVRPTDPLAALYDPSIPIAVRECELHGLRAQVCGIVLLFAIDQGSPLPPWLSLALVERLIHGTHANLRQIASTPGIAVPDDIVAPHERLDIHALEAEVLADEARAQEWMNAAEASGQDVYFPTDGAEHA